MSENPDPGFDEFIERAATGDAWMPQLEGSTDPNPLNGTVLGYELTDREYDSDDPELEGKCAWILKVRAYPDGKVWSVWSWQKAIRKKVEELQPEPGERVSIRFKGVSSNPAPGRKPAFQYSITIDRGVRLPELRAAAPVDERPALRADAVGTVVEDADVVEPAQPQPENTEVADDDIPF